MTTIDVRAARQVIRDVLLETTQETWSKDDFRWENEAESEAEFYIAEFQELFWERSYFGMFDAAGREIFAPTARTGAGVEIVADAARTIVSAFERVYAINRQGISLSVDKAVRGSGQTVGDRYSVQVSVFWRAYAARGPLVIK